MTTRGDAIMTFSHRDTWLDALHREFCRPPDQVYRHLVADPRIRRLLVADPWRSRPIDLVRRAQGRRPAAPATDHEAHLRPMGWRRSEPTSLPTMQRRYRAYARLLRHAAKRASLDDPAVVTFNPFAAAFSPMPWASSVVYYGRDDWAAFDTARRWHPIIEAAYAEIRARRITVCTVSRELANRVAGPERGIVIPNGIDADLWQLRRPTPTRVANLPRPCGVYAGTVDDRLDVSAVVELVRSGTLASVAIVGPIGAPQVAAALAAEPNVHLFGSLSQAELAATLMALDVCLLPHVVTPLTKAMSPLKLYEYVASGTPVVATDLPPVRDVDPRVILVDDGDYASAVKKAMEIGRAEEGARMAFVESNAWSSRLSVLVDAMFNTTGGHA